MLLLKQGRIGDLGVFSALTESRSENGAGWLSSAELPVRLFGTLLRGLLLPEAVSLLATSTANERCLDGF